MGGLNSFVLIPKQFISRYGCGGTLAVTGQSVQTHSEERRQTKCLIHP